MGRKHAFFFAEEAKWEIKDSYNWYESRLPDLGERFLSDVDDCLNRIDSNPELFRIVYRNHRQVQLTHFPFVVIYEIKKNAIQVMSVFHTSRNPDQKLH